MVSAVEPVTSVEDIQSAFLAELPRFAAHARYAFRHVKCPHERADRRAEALALAWRQFVRLSRRGRDPSRFVTTLALRCTQAVKAGRRLVRSDSARDALSPVARVRHGFAVSGFDRLPRRDPRLADALVDNSVTSVPDQAAFRVDFPRWRAAFGARDRAVLDALTASERTGEVARRFEVSPSRVGRLRSRFAAGWAAFQGG